MREENDLMPFDFPTMPVFTNYDNTIESSIGQIELLLRDIDHKTLKDSVLVPTYTKDAEGKIRIFSWVIHRREGNAIIGVRELLDETKKETS